MKNAFTLAEVLITLGIVGVVAAITIPNIVANYQKKITVGRLKVAYNIFSNAIEQAQEDYGNPIILPETLPENFSSYKTYISATYFEPYLKDVQPLNKIIYAKTPDRKNTYLTYGLSEHNQMQCIANGICYNLYRHATGYIKLYLDLNGAKGPNVSGRDVFELDMTGNYNPSLGYRELAIPHPYVEGSWSAFGSTIDGNCNKNSNGNTCASKIIRDGWQIKDDYPW